MTMEAPMFDEFMTALAAQWLWTAFVFAAGFVAGRARGAQGESNAT